MRPGSPHPPSTRPPCAKAPPSMRATARSATGPLEATARRGRRACARRRRSCRRREAPSRPGRSSGSFATASSSRRCRPSRTFSRRPRAGPPRPSSRGSRSCRAAAGAAEIVVDHGHLGPVQLTGSPIKSVLSPPALVIAQDLVLRRLADIDERPAREMFRRDLAHRRPPSCPAPTPPAAGSPAVAEVAASHPEAVRPSPQRTDPAARLLRVVPSRSPSVSSGSNDTAGSARRRRALSAANGNRGAGRIDEAAAAGEHIHSGTWVSVPSVVEPPASQRHGSSDVGQPRSAWKRT